MSEKTTHAVDNVELPSDRTLRNSSKIEYANEVAEKNVRLSIDRIRKESPILAEMEQSLKIKILSNMYSNNSGKVIIYD